MDSGANWVFCTRNCFQSVFERNNPCHLRHTVPDIFRLANLQIRTGVQQTLTWQVDEKGVFETCYENKNSQFLAIWFSYRFAFEKRTSIEIGFGGASLTFTTMNSERPLWRVKRTSEIIERMSAFDPMQSFILHLHNTFKHVGQLNDFFLHSLKKYNKLI